MVSGVRATPGELSFDVAIAGEQRIWLRTDADVVPNADAIVPAVLLPAMTAGGTLEIPEPLSSRLLDALPGIQHLLRAWQEFFPAAFWAARAKAVEVSAQRRDGPVSRGDGVAAFFSGGVDSFVTLAEHPEVTHLVFVRGADIPVERSGFGDRVERDVRQVAAAAGKQIVTVQTNLRDLTDRTVPWEACFGSALAAAAMLLTPLLRRAHIAGDYCYRAARPRGAHYLLDRRWSTEHVEILSDGARFTRTQKVERIADDPLAQELLRVCWQNAGEELNCGRCEKCLRTMVALDALGVLDRFAVFPRRVDAGQVAALEIQPVVTAYWHENRELARARGRDDLVAAIERALGPARIGRPFRPARTPGARSPGGEPRIAVVVPAFRQADHLAGAVTSALDQEVATGVVIVDDGCPDDRTRQVAALMATAHPARVRVVCQENRGLSAARNAGIDVALATWPQLESLFPLDADNLLLPTALADLHHTLERHPQAAWVSPQLEMFGAEDRTWGFPPPITLYRQLFENHCDAGSLFRRAVFDSGLRYDESLRAGYEDWELVVRAMRAGLHGVLGGAHGFLYRRAAASMAGRAGRNRAAVWGLVRERHAELYAPRALTVLEHEEVPRFAIVLPDRDQVLSLAAADLPPRRMPLPDFVARVDAGAGGVLPTSDSLPPVTVVTTGAAYDALVQRRLLAGTLLRAQQVLHTRACAAIGEAAVCCTTRTLFATRGHVAPDIVLPPGDLPALGAAAVTAAFAALRPRSHDAVPPIDYRTVSSFACARHVEGFDTTFPWAGDGPHLVVTGADAPPTDGFATVTLAGGLDPASERQLLDCIRASADAVVCT